MKKIIYSFILLVIIGGGSYYFMTTDKMEIDNDKIKEIEDIINATTTPVINIDENNNQDGVVATYDSYVGQLINELGNDPIINKFPAKTVNSYRDELIRLEGVLQEKPQDIASWMQVAQLKKVFNNYEGARDAWEYVRYLLPDDAAVHFNLGTLYGFQLKDYERADILLQRALELEKRETNYYVNIADFYRNFYTVKKEKVEEVLLKGLEEMPNEISLMAYLAGYYSSIDRVAEAIEYYEKILEVDSDNNSIKQEVEKLKNN